MAARDYELIDAEKIAEQARFYLREGPEGCLRVSDELRAHALALRPETPEERDEDVRAHVRLRELYDRIHARRLLGR